MKNLDLSKLTSEQERTLYDAYRYIRQRAAKLRAQKNATENKNSTDAAEVNNPHQSVQLTAGKS